MASGRSSIYPSTSSLGWAAIRAVVRTGDTVVDAIRSAGGEAAFCAADVTRTADGVTEISAAKGFLRELKPEDVGYSSSEFWPGALKSTTWKGKLYGLPMQTPASFTRTIAQIAELRPDRIALYAYAHQPQRFKPQPGRSRCMVPLTESYPTSL